ncbi:hypothetical protein RD792_007070 [Penstemon davidsonii]|uniref:TCP domain-containing protein n=1 Tax=Penstemon davidsonii TaxID=160366 RepID=A0ABR0D5M1_9LAMI|nr:hypothetical protein RD792_007070 [Penstemon davidsonii]
MKGTTGGSGEIVQVQGGHILRSTGRKDRHSKVYTSKGPRDRRVRLAAHTAIQFYDVQDRLGYDRPSKAVDWLMNKAKNAIDKLNEPHPSPYSNNPSSREDPSPTGYESIQPDIGNNSSFMQPDPHFVNTIKSFFPTSSLSLPDDFSNDQPRGTNSFDLGLSLHTLQARENNGNSNVNNFQESFQRMDCNWNGNGNGNGIMDNNRVGFMMNSHEMAQEAVFTQSFSFTQRELLQSNSLVDAWNGRQLGYTEPARNSSNFGGHFEMGFGVPARIYGEDEPETHN